MLVSKKGERLEISFLYRSDLVSFMKTLPGRKYHPALRIWSIPSAGSSESVLKLLKKGFRVDDAIINAMEEDRKTGDEAVSLSLKEDVPFDSPLPLFPFQRVGAAFLSKVGSGLLGDSPGCISGDSIVRIGRAGRTSEMSIENLFMKINSKSGRWDKSVKTYIRALCDGVFRLHKVSSVLKNGIKETITIETVSGKKISLTKDHEICVSMRGDIFIPAGSLSVGNTIIVNGTPVCRNTECQSTENIITYQYSKFLGYCKKCMYRKLRKSNKKNGYSIEKGYKVLSGVFDNGRSRSRIFEHVYIAEKMIGRKLLKNEVVHHKNEDTLDNSTENLEVLTKSEHARIHGKNKGFTRLDGSISAKGGLVVFIPKEDIIKSIYNSGLKDVYDIVCEEPYRNFVANGIVVHNCGKTIQSLAVCEHTKARKVLIFCPSAVKYQWQGEITKFLPERSSVVITGSKTERTACWKKDVNFYVANYELLLRDLPEMQAIDWDVIIADEATRISNYQAKTTKALKKLKAKRHLALTGTPVSNAAQEVFSIIDWVAPGYLGGYWEFIQRYCLKNYFGAISGYQNLDELNGKLKRYMIRRTKEEVLPELPEKIVTDIPFDLSDEEKALYRKIKEEILFEIEKMDFSKVERPMTVQFTLVKMTRLRQLADSMELLGESEKSSKVEVLKELLEGLGEVKVIIFSQFSQMVDILERELYSYNPVKITGEVSGIDRKRVLERFNNDDDCKILIMSEAGAYGLNVQAASVVINFDQPWSVAKMEQRVGRAHRMGQKNKVQVFNLLAKGTIDYYIAKVLRSKGELSEKILGMREIKEMLDVPF